MNQNDITIEDTIISEDSDYLDLEIKNSKINYAG